MMIKLISDLLNSSKKEIINGAISEKSSGIWGADEEFNYSRASELLGSGIPQPTKLSTYTGYVSQYGNNIWVYAAVYQIAISIASIPFSLYKKPRGKKGKTIFDDPKHQLVKVFSRPNPFMSMFDLIEAIVAGLELTGNAYIEEVKDKSKKLIELYPLQPHKVEIVPDPRTMIKGYLYNAGVITIKFNEEEITHIKYHNPTSDFYGQTPMSPGEVVVLTDNYTKDWRRRFFLNSAIPGGVLETNDSLSDSVVKRLKTQWKTAHKGIKRAHEIAILEGGLKWRNIEVSARDMDLANLNRKDRDEILVSFGVPPAILGIIDEANNSIIDNVKKMFWENTLLPKMEKIEASVNYNLVWPYDDSIIASFDKDSIEGLKGSQETRARIAGMLVDRGIMTQNEVRKKYFNMPDVNWGNIWYMPLNLIPVEKAGQGLGTGEGGEGDRVPGRLIGRPPVEQENIKKELLYRFIRTLDNNVDNMFGYKHEDMELLLEELKADGTEVQSFLFDKEVFTVEEARNWLKEHDKRSDKLDETEDKYRFRQFPPSRCSENSFATINITNGIEAIICKPKSKDFEDNE